MVEGSHGARLRYLHSLAVVAVKVVYKLVALGYARGKVGPIVQWLVLGVEVVHGWVYVLGAVVVVAVKAYACCLV